MQCFFHCQLGPSWSAAGWVWGLGSCVHLRVTLLRLLMKNQVSDCPQVCHPEPLDQPELHFLGWACGSYSSLGGNIHLEG